MITISELFPFYSTAYKWLSLFRKINPGEEVRLEKEYTVKTVRRDNEEYRVDGILHRRDGPAWIGKNDSCINISWFLFGKLHRTDGPAVFESNSVDGTWFEKWFENGKYMISDKPNVIFNSTNHRYYDVQGQLHRENGPAIIQYSESGKIIKETWYTNGEWHRKNGPTEISYRKNGKIYWEYWYRQDEIHRKDGPAVIHYNKKGDVTIERWYMNDLLHRTDGPAVIRYKNNRIIKTSYWLQDIKQRRFEEVAVIQDFFDA